MGNSSAVVFATLGAVSGVSLLFTVWYLWSLSRLFPRLGLPAWEGWVPLLNQWRLLERAGFPGWIILLGLVSLGIVPLVVLIIAAHRLNQEVGAGTGMTVLAIFLPPLWAMLLADRFDEAGAGAAPNLLSRVADPAGGARPNPPVPEPTQPSATSAWAPPPTYVSGPPPPPSWNAPPPPGSAQPAPTPSIAAPPVHPAAQSGWAPSAPPASAFTPPPPVELPQEDDADDHTIVSAPEVEDDDHTIVVAKTPEVQWILEIDGREYTLSPETIIGRAPTGTATAVGLAIDDASRVLSKSHARLRQEGDGWMIQDLGSTNGTTLIHDDGRHEELTAHVEVQATEHLELGTLPAHLRRV